MSTSPPPNLAETAMGVKGIVLLSIWNFFGLLSSEKGEVAELTCACREDFLQIDCRLGKIGAGELWTELSAGDEIHFVYRLWLTRKTPSWFQETVMDIEIHKYLKYNNLSRQFIGRSKMGGTVLEDVLFDALDGAVGWLMSLQRVKVYARPQDWRKVDGQIKARALLGKRRLLYLIPYEVSTPSKKAQVTCP